MLNNHPLVFFNNLPINRKSIQKHLGLLLDEKLFFSEHINEELKKVTKSINLIGKPNLIWKNWISAIQYSFSNNRCYQRLINRKIVSRVKFEFLKDRRWMMRKLFIRSYHQNDFPISMICYFHYKDLNETNVSFSNCCVEQKFSKSLFYLTR